MTSLPAQRHVHRICPVCEACCGLELTIEDERIVGVRGSKDDFFSAGYICPKGVALKDLHEDPDRLRQPLIKRGGRFEPASFADAFAEIERRLIPILERHGRDAAAVYLGNPTAHKLSLSLYARHLIGALKTQNLYSASTLDQMPKQMSCGLMFGNILSIPVPDIDRTDYLMILGANPMASNGSLWTVPDFRGRARALKARGGKLVVIDPRRSETAEIADEHHFLRPGMDAPFLLGLAAALIDQDLVDLRAVAPHLNGVDEAAAAIRAYPPERVESATGVPAATLRRLARELAMAPAAAVYGRIGTCTQEFGTLSSWAVDVLNILTGNLDRPGGAMFPKAPAFAANTAGKGGSGRGFVTGRRHSRVSRAPEVCGEFPATCLAEEIETPGDGQVKALFVIAGNPVSSMPNGARLARAAASLDLMVSLDIYLNETSRLADVILPGVSPLEESHYDIAFPQLAYRNAARYSAPVFPIPDGQLAEWEILSRLAAIAKGEGASAVLHTSDDATSRWSGPERQLDLALRNGPYGLDLDKVSAQSVGIDLGPLAPRMPEILRTQSGKIEMAPEIILNDLKRLDSALDAPAPRLVIIGRRQVRSNNSWMHNLPTLAKGPNRCTVLVHESDASAFGLSHGARARITRGNHSIEAEVAVSDEVMPGVISLPHGWGHDLPGMNLRVAAERPGANLNTILDEERRDPLSGTSVLSGIPVELSPCA